jgi:hypothetical protein
MLSRISSALASPAMVLISAAENAMAGAGAPVGNQLAVNTHRLFTGAAFFQVGSLTEVGGTVLTSNSALLNISKGRHGFDLFESCSQRNDDSKQDPLLFRA